MNEQMVDIYRCADRVEAETIRIRLAAAGINAFVRGDDAVTSMGMSGGGVNTAIVLVEVAFDDQKRATKILEEDRQRRTTLGDWTCDECSEKNDAAFDLCWKCSNARVAVDLALSDMEPADPLTVNQDNTIADDDDFNPYRPIVMDPEMSSDTESNGRFKYWAIFAVILVGLLTWIAN